MSATFEKDLVLALREVVEGTGWQDAGEVDSFKIDTCNRLFCEDGDDIVLVRTPDGSFYSMTAVCPHAGGALDQGDIEDLGDRWAIFCPLHYYEFDLQTGESSSGLKTEVYPVHVADGRVYVKISTTLSLESWRRDSMQEQDCKISDADLAPDRVSNGPSDGNTLSHWAVTILNTGNSKMKVELTHTANKLWKDGEIGDTGCVEPPDQPKRDSSLIVVAPGKEKKRKKGGPVSSRESLLHSLANIEQWAIDLSWDIIARFADFKLPDKSGLPKEFFDDFVQVAAEEAKHFELIEERLKNTGGFFGKLPIHIGLWTSAQETAHSLLARLAVVHMVHEARGLDVQPKTLEKFANNGDEESVKVLEVIYKDEITHVAAGLKWFTYICEHQDPPLDCITTFHNLVKKYFKGYLKPPFNAQGRLKAGMTQEWYIPLIKPNE